MVEIAPGSILQMMYFKRRLEKFVYHSFLEIGSGTGTFSRLFLSKGYSGVGLDLNKSSCDVNEEKNADFIRRGRYRVMNENFFDVKFEQKFDIIFSSMVIEHLSPQDVEKYLITSLNNLEKGGRMIFFVPANPKKWGIEDEIAGHYKRYTFRDFDDLAEKNHFHIECMTGLTYPLSNIIFPISNFLVNRSESKKIDLTLQERTVLSSNRKVKFKTDFPGYFKLLLNEFTMYPFYVLQNLFLKNKNAMVIYCELKKK